MNIQTKYVRTNFVPNSSVSYNQIILKKYFKSQKKNQPIKKSSSLTKNQTEIEHEVPQSFSTNRRVEVEKWLKQMDLPSRVKLFSIQNKWLSQMVQQMFYYYRMNANNRFLLKPEEYPNEEYYLQYYYNENQNNYLNLNNENNYNYQFEIIKSLANQENSSISEERSFLERVRFFDLKEANDSITLSISLLNNIEELFFFLDFFSKKKGFFTPCM